MPLVLNTEKFINCVRKKPQLWDKLNPMYRHLEISNALWKEVSKETGGNVQAVHLKQKWHNLRDVFRRELRSVSGCDEKCVRRDASCLPGNAPEHEDSFFLKTETSEETLHDADSSHSVVISKEHGTAGEETIRVKHEPGESEQSEEPARRSRTFPDDDDYYFAMSVIPHMRQVPIHRKLRMRIKISEIIAQESRDGENFT